MHKKFASQSGFFDFRVLTALFVVSSCVVVAFFATANPLGLLSDPASRAFEPTKELQTIGRYNGASRDTDNVETALADGAPTPTPTPDVVLYDQYDNFATKEPLDIPSQDAETALDFFDSQAADDFIVPAGQTWHVTEVDVLAEYDSTGPAASFHVFFYENGTGDLPGVLVASPTREPL